MTRKLDTNEHIWANFNGFITYIGEKSIGLSKIPHASRADVVLPLSQVGRIYYADDGEKRDLIKNKRIESVVLPRWLARKKKLIANWE